VFTEPYACLEDSPFSAAPNQRETRNLCVPRLLSCNCGHRNRVSVASLNVSASWMVDKPADSGRSSPQIPRLSLISLYRRLVSSSGWTPSSFSRMRTHSWYWRSAALRLPASEYSCISCLWAGSWRHRVKASVELSLSLHRNALRPYKQGPIAPMHLLAHAADSQIA